MELIDNLPVDSSASSFSLLGCANGVPYYKVIRYVCGNAVSTWVNMQTGEVVDTEPTGFQFGECADFCADEPILDCNGNVLGYGYTAIIAPTVGATVPLEDCSGNVLAYAMPNYDTNHIVPIGYCDATVAGYLRISGCDPCCTTTCPTVTASSSIATSWT